MTIIFNGRADAGATEATYAWKEKAREDSIQVRQGPDGLGAMFRFSVKPTDAFVNGAWRAELSTHIAAPLSEEWYHQEIYLLDSDIPQYLTNALLGQWHSVDEGAESYGRQPPIDFVMDNRDLVRISKRYDANLTSIAAPNSVTTVELAQYPIQPLIGRRVPIVVHAKWDWGPAGLIELWIDHYPVISSIGPLSFNDAQGPYIKIGISHIVTFGNGGYEFAMYNSGCKIGDANSSYYEMAGRHPNGKSVVQNGLF
jgi:hypothetical protein